MSEKPFGVIIKQQDMRPKIDGSVQDHEEDDIDSASSSEEVANESKDSRIRPN